MCVTGHIGHRTSRLVVCVQTVEEGKMTKDLALLVGPDQSWLTTEEFLAAIDENLAAAQG
jgi:isocitrate dehydrogenase